MFISCNGVPVTAGELVMGRVGAWTGDLALDGPPPAAGERCSIAVGDGQVVFSGTALDRPGVFRERYGVKVVGGAGGLAKSIGPTQHRAVPLEVPLRSILDAAGETLSSTADTSTLAARFDAWTRRAGPAADAITELLAETGATWRVLGDGTVWVGQETWPSLSVMVQTLREEPSDDTALVATDLPVLRPGVTIAGRRVSAVAHRFEAKSIRTRVWYERGTPALDRLKTALVGIVQAVTAKVDYHPSYAATVVAQQGDGDLQVRFDDDRFRDDENRGVAGVAAWPGVPGISYALRRGARVLIAFLDGRGRAPIVTGWTSGQPERVTLEADRIELGEHASRGLARLDDDVQCFSISAFGNVLTITPPTGEPIVITFASSSPVTVTATGGSEAVGKIASASSKSFGE